MAFPARSLIGLALSAALLVSAHAAPLRADHPLLGTWKLALPDGSCSEVYHFRPDGTGLVTSAQEVAETTFTISDQPSARGFYLLTDTLVRDNGKPDCAGNITPVGQKASHHVVFHHSGQMFLMCQDEDMEACMGPFVSENGVPV